MGLGAEEASLTHRLEHQVNVPVILRPNNIQETDDVGMIPKLLQRESRVCALGLRGCAFCPCLGRLGRQADGLSHSPGAA